MRLPSGQWESDQWPYSQKRVILSPQASITAKASQQGVGQRDRPLHVRWGFLSLSLCRQPHSCESMSGIAMPCLGDSIFIFQI